MLDLAFFYSEYWQFGKFYTFALSQAQMAELVDALVSGTSISNYVQVRVLFWAHSDFITPCRLSSLQGVFALWGKARGKIFFRAKTTLH